MKPNQNTKITRCCIYVRTNRKFPEAEEVLRHQERVCRNYIHDRRSEGWTLIDVYWDSSCSGRPLKRRGFRRMMKAIRGGAYEMVVVDRLDRLARAHDDLIELFRQFMLSGARLSALDQQGRKGSFRVTIHFGRTF